ncbi:hypothetical protein K0U83_03135 [bacterium]|nr:hypothetical protein [bacterium]
MVRPRIPTSGFTHQTLAQVRVILTAHGYDPVAIEERVDVIRKERAALKAQNLKMHRSVTYWRYLRTPLKREIDVSKSSLQYLRRTDLDDGLAARREAYEAYLAVLTRLLSQFDEYIEINPSTTPNKVIQQEQERGKLKYVTQGEHWVDWVPAKIKARVTEMFAAVPYRKQAKTKKPFERKIPKGSQRSRRIVLEQAMAKELETLTLKHAAYTPNDAMSEELRDEMLAQQERAMAKIQKIKRAQSRLAQKQDNKPFPVTWHGLLTEEDGNV